MPQEKKLPLYRIVGYDDHFENFKSRTVDRCAFVCVPNKHGGTGLSNVLGEPNGAAIYGIWMLILQVCSRQRKPREGWITADGRKGGRRLSIRELANQLRRKDEEIEDCLRVCSSPEVGFIEKVDGEHEWIPQSQAGDTTVSDEYPIGISNSDDEGRNERKKLLSLGDQRKADTEQIPPASQADTTVSDKYQIADAKRILSALSVTAFPDEVPGSVWPYEVERQLSEQVPIRRESLELVDWAYRLPANHELFDNSHGGMMRRKSFASLVTNLKSEASKVRSARSKIGLNGLHNSEADDDGPGSGWSGERRAAYWRVCPEAVMMPSRFSELGTSMCDLIDAEVKRKK